MIAKNPDDERRIAELATDPMQFIALCWPEMRLYDKQEDVLRSVVDNGETFVHAANKTGKSRIAAITAIWFFCSRTPARVIFTSSSERQLRNILWKDIKHLIATSARKLPLEIKDLEILKLPEGPGQRPDHQSFMLAHVTHTVESFQGHHLPSDKPRVLAIFDETSGIQDEFYDAAQSWAQRMLVIGNPLSTDNFFYHGCKQGDLVDPADKEVLMRRVIHIDGRDVPNVKMGLAMKKLGLTAKPPVYIPGLLTYAEYLRRKAMWDEVKRTTRLDGKFYEGGYQFLYPATVLDIAMDRTRWLDLQQRDRQAEAMGVDVAWGGRDKTCWTIIDRFGIIEQIVRDMRNSMEVAGMTQHLMHKHNLAASRVLFDAGGGGQQITDRIREQGVYVSSVNFSEGAKEKKAFLNRRAEMYGKLSELFDADREEGIFALPPDAQELRAELNILPLRHDSEGRLALPPKQHRHAGSSTEKSIRQLLGRSPDRADSLALAAWVLHYSREYDDLSKHVYAWDYEPMTAEDIATMPEEMKQIHDYYDEQDRDHEDDEWDRWEERYW
ncbi:Terminase-like family protein [Symmachiella dynata]|uniref:Terminase-like family protein n=1 Tax=Symmachiella dynata TaxID=2527995 RepID=A0A517ZQ42_9PLAN|nr:hypothetical protein [Symmachiella dynata]QDU44563.1 Terminase-like family protein [Symmachiella dynata]